MADRTNYPEVVHNDQNYPEVVPNYQQYPEAVHPTTVEQSFPYSTTPRSEKSAAVNVPTYYESTQNKQASGDYYAVGHDDDDVAHQAAIPPKKQRICGLSKKAFIIVLVVGIVVVLAAVLGGVLGGVLGSKNSSTSSSSSNNSSSNSTSSSSSAANTTTALRAHSGLSLLQPSGSTTLYAYWFNAGGDIVEAAYANGAWSKNGTTSNATISIVAKGVSSDSIAAISYTLQNQQYRQLFYFNAQGYVQTINATGSTWNTPYQPLPDAQAYSQNAIAAVAGNDASGLDGIRVYFNSVQGHTQEIGLDFSGGDGLWHMWATFGGDKTAGVASVVVDGYNHLYLRNATTGALSQWTWNYHNVTGLWSPGLSFTASDVSVASGGSITAASDGTGTDYIYYQNGQGAVVRTTTNIAGSKVNAATDGTSALPAIGSGYGMSATWSTANNGPLIMHQSTNDTMRVLFTTMGNNGQVATTGTDTAHSA